MQEQLSEEQVQGMIYISFLRKKEASERFLFNGRFP